MTTLRRFVAEHNSEALVIENADDAIIGYVERCSQPAVACYDYNKLVQVFIDQGMTYEESEEWISHNIAGAWMGHQTPMILYVPGDEEEDTEGGPAPGEKPPS
jgi:hypothetical protein